MKDAGQIPNIYLIARILPESLEGWRADVVRLDQRMFAQIYQ